MPGPNPCVPRRWTSHAKTSYRKWKQPGKALALKQQLEAVRWQPLILATLHQAFAIGRTPAIFHSDQGTEFMAQRCTDYLEARGAQISVSDVASPWQNGYIESFYGRFKHELGDLNRLETAGEAIEVICRHIHYYTSQLHPRRSHDAACRLYCTNVLRNLSS